MSDDHITQPLDQQFRTVFNKTTQKEEKIPALDRFFKIERQFLTYTAPPLSILNPSSIDYQATLEEYEERLKIIEQDLKWILSLPYQKFWCQIIYDLSCQKMIDSYLKLAPRPYDMLKIQIPRQISNLHNSIHRYVFIVCLRMSTYKESKENFISQSVFANLVYDNYLFDIPKILDLCVLYQKNPVLNKIIENLFNSQSRYYDDFKACLKDIIKAIETSKKKLRTIFELDFMYSLSGSKSVSLSDKISKSLKEILEIVYYLTDFVQTLANLVSIQTNLAQFLFDQKFENNIKDLMETTLFDIGDIINRMRKESELNNETASLIKIKLSALKYQMAKVFSLILQHSLIDPIIENVDTFKTSQQIQSLIDNFVKICCDILDDKRFMCYYEEKFNLSEQIDLVYQVSGGKMDKSQYDYMIDNLRSSVREFSRKSKIKEKFSDSVEKKESNSENKNEFINSNSEIKPGTSASFDSDDALVQSVLDFLPDLDKNLVKKCLQYFNNNVEQVINAFLENNLPVFAPEELEPEIPEEFSELSSRKNIYDNDEFDVFKKDKIDMSKIYIGKKNATDNFDLDNKDDIRRDYTAFSYEEHYEEDVYQDEYDDTYDSNINANDNYDVFAIKPLNQKLDIKKRDIFEIDSDEEDNEEEENENEAEEKTKETSKIEPQEAQRQQGQQQRPQQQKFQGRGGNRGGGHQRQGQGRGYQLQQSQNQQQRRPEQRNEQNFQQRHQPEQNQHQQRRTEQRNEQNFQQRHQPEQNQHQQQRRTEYRNEQQAQPRYQQEQNQYQQQQRRQDQRNEQNFQQAQGAQAKDVRQDQRPAQLPQRQQFKNRQKETGDKRNQDEDNAEANAESVQKTEEEIKRERRWKNDNKATIAHHNRKYLSMKKTGFL
ncbi:unnamed protein product [Brachionus calyciflorus]|uniref:CUE domain-containing protein n=1 Tax=Brachionus calyciflorus TaxID=104777 RepID=A0A813TCC4_9BILA|nr:unnamed protein product [Brachionus calyciflorus]